VDAAPAVSYLLPALRVDGPFGSEWRSELELANPCADTAIVSVELLLEGRKPAPPPARLELGPDERRLVADVLGELFAADGVGALRVTGESGCANVLLRIRDVRGALPPGPPLGGFDVPHRLGRGRAIEIPGLASEPAGPGRTRASLGLLNLSRTAIGLEVAVVGPSGAELGARELRLRPRELRQLDDVFAAAGVSSAAAGSVRISSPTVGARVLAYAIVVRRTPPAFELLFPEPALPR
jgi:hypothetical protein